MNAKWLAGMTLGCLLLVSGCAGGTSTESNQAGGASGSTSQYDDGPRAAEQPVDAALATQGEQLFKDKGCSACHAFGQKLSGPDLQGVANRRTAAWIEHQILQPDVMAKEDPIARGLIAEHALQMPNQGLTLDEAKAVIEFLKSKESVAASPQ